jgi:hypothetical protein
MRSISAKILLWTLLMFLASLIAFAGISYILATTTPGPRDFFVQTARMMQSEAVRSFEEGGSAELAENLNRLNSYYTARHYLTDARGIDLATGEDRSALIVETSSMRPIRLSCRDSPIRSGSCPTSPG